VLPAWCSAIAEAASFARISGECENSSSQRCSSSSSSRMIEAISFYSLSGKDFNLVITRSSKSVIVTDSMLYSSSLPLNTNKLPFDYDFIKESAA
jgi:hypothetical protein